MPLTKGEKFAVVVKFTTPGDNDPVPVQQRVGGTDDNNAPNAIPGQSFYSLDGTTWTDLAVTYGAENSYVANIHAFAVAGSNNGRLVTCRDRAECKQPRPLCQRQRRRPLPQVLDGHDLDGVNVSRRESDLRPRCDVTRPGYMDVFMRGSDGALWSRDYHE